MFVYCVYMGDKYENDCFLLSHSTSYSQEEFNELCSSICDTLINSTSNDDIMGAEDGEKTDALFYGMSGVLINEYGFDVLKDFPVFHVESIDSSDWFEDY